MGRATESRLGGADPTRITLRVFRRAGRVKPSPPSLLASTRQQGSGTDRTYHTVWEMCNKDTCSRTTTTNTNSSNINSNTTHTTHTNPCNSTVVAHKAKATTGMISEALLTGQDRERHGTAGLGAPPHLHRHTTAMARKVRGKERTVRRCTCPRDVALGEQGFHPLQSPYRRRVRRCSMGVERGFVVWRRRWTYVKGEGRGRMLRTLAINLFTLLGVMCECVILAVLFVCVVGRLTVRFAWQD